MLQIKSKLTVGLKIYSVLVLLYSTITSFVASNITIKGIPHPVLVESILVVLLTITVNFMLILVIYRNKKVSALFLPCLLYSIMCLVSLFADVSNYKSILSFGLLFDFNVGLFAFNIVSNTLCSLIWAVILFLIAIDSKRGSRFALAELITLVVLSLLNLLIGAIPSGFFGISQNLSLSIILDQLTYSILNSVFSPGIIIIILLWRIHSWRKESEVPISQIEQTTEDNPDISQ